MDKSSADLTELELGISISTHWLSLIHLSMENSGMWDEVVSSLNPLPIEAKLKYHRSSSFFLF